MTEAQVEKVCLYMELFHELSTQVKLLDSLIAENHSKVVADSCEFLIIYIFLIINPKYVTQKVLRQSHHSNERH